jgi:hypothetical protein
MRAERSSLLPTHVCQVYILDKTENNTLKFNNYTAWATVYDTTQNTATPLAVVTNTFCAGGSQLGQLYHPAICHGSL